MSLSKRLVAGAAAVALGMGIMLVGGASPAGAAVTDSNTWIWCDPTPLSTQKQMVPTRLEVPDSVSPGDTFDVKINTQLPSIVLNSFIIYDSDAVWQMPEQVTVNSVTFAGGDSGDPAFNNGETSHWAGTAWINPTIDEILEKNEWFLGASADDYPYPPFPSGSQAIPIPSAVPEGWEPNGNTILVQSLPDPGLFMGPSGLGFRGRPTPQGLVINVTVKEDVQQDTWIEWKLPLASHSHANGLNLETNTSCTPPAFCPPGVNPHDCSRLPVVGENPPPPQRNTARFILGQTGIGNPFPDFLDTPRWHVFYPEIYWMGDEGISEGFPVAGGANYEPNTTLTRMAMSAFLYRLENGSAPPPVCETQPFVDVPVDHQFCPQIAWMAEEGISTGYDTPEGKKYQPNTPLTRMAMSAFLFRLAEGDSTPPNCTPQVFLDVPPGSDFCGEIKWMAETGISEGYPVEGGFEYRPTLELARQAMSAFMYRYAHLEV